MARPHGLFTPKRVAAAAMLVVALLSAAPRTTAARPSSRSSSSSAAKARASKGGGGSGTSCSSLASSCDFTTAADVNAAIKWYTATFKVTVGGGGGGDDDYGYDDDYPADDEAPPPADDDPAKSACITDIRNSIGAVSLDCSELESGASVAAVGCPEGMKAVSIGCALFSAGFFIPALGATGIVQGDSASCAFPSRDLLEPEWAAFPYAMILNCAYLEVSEEQGAKQAAARRLAEAVKAYEKALGRGSRVAPGSKAAVEQRQAEAETMLWVGKGQKSLAAFKTSADNKKARAQRVVAEVAAADAGKKDL